MGECRYNCIHFLKSAQFGNKKMKELIIIIYFYCDNMTPKRPNKGAEEEQQSKCM
jgi:hypothetical protein